MNAYVWHFFALDGVGVETNDAFFQAFISSRGSTMYVTKEVVIPGLIAYDEFSILGPHTYLNFLPTSPNWLNPSSPSAL